MALDPTVNFFRSEIATLPVTAGGVTIVLATGDGAKLPNPAVDGAFNLTIYNEADQFTAPEIVRVTAKSSDTLTVTRAQEGTTGTTKTAGATWVVVLTPTSKMISDIDSTKLDVAGGTMTGDLKIIKDEPTALFGLRINNPNTAIGARTALRFGYIDVDFEVGRGTEIRSVTNQSNGRTRDIQFWTDNLGTINQIVTFKAAGNVGIGTTTPATKLDVNGDVTITDKIIHSGDTETAIRFPSVGTVAIETPSNNDVLTLRRASVPGRAINLMPAGFSDIGAGFSEIHQKISFTGGVAAVLDVTGRLLINATGNVGIGATSPANPLTVNGIVSASTDNTRTLGTASLRWSEVFAGNSTINTSDATEKRDFAKLDNAEKAVAKTLKKSVKKFRWKKAYDKKGEDARIHVGINAQDVAQAFTDNGLDPEKYGVFCRDVWHTKDETTTDDNGNEQLNTVYCESDDPNAIEHVRYGVRYDQLWAFIISTL